MAVMEVTAEEREFIELLRDAHLESQNKALMKQLFNLLGRIKAGEQWADRVTEYLEALIDAEALVKAVEQDEPPDGEDRPNWRNELRASFVDAVIGNARLIEEVWYISQK
jgi:hypothetical protein